MTKRRVVVIGMALTLLTGAAVSTLAYLHFREPYPVRAYYKIEVGMTPDEIAAVIGQLPGDYARFGPATQGVKLHEADEKLVNAVQWQRWDWDDCWIVIAFDDEAKAVFTGLYANQNPPTLFQRVKQWVGW